ncbi:MAG: phosphoribosylglycinamide formyltransferase [Firmicutes bacterium]|nr:phosphoribosylglycinamide formyltransferase [Bacillota bacterium]
MLKRRIAVLVSGGGTNLQALIDRQQAGDIPHGQLTVVIADNPQAYALQRGEKAGLAVAAIPRRQMSQEQFEGELQATLEKYDIEVIVLAGFLCILSANFLRKWQERVINIHPSLIPSFCGKGFYGLRVHQAALDYGVKVTGATVHFVNEIPDGGKIILQKAVAVLPDDTPETLQRRVMEEAEWQLLPQAVEMVCAKLCEEQADRE